MVSCRKIAQKASGLLSVFLAFAVMCTYICVPSASAAANTESVSIILGKTPIENGIHAWPGDDPNGLITGELDGKTYWQTNKASGNPATVYLYMNVDDSFVFDNKDYDIQVTVEYYDAGNGSIVLQYDSDTAPFKDAPLFNYTDTKRWRTYTFDLTDAKFANRTNGADFRVGIEGGGASASTNQDLRVASITVTKRTRINVPMQTTVIKTVYPTKDVVIANFNVKDFGAVGDGQTDDTYAIQKAINAAAKEGGGVVYVPAGTYKILGDLDIKTGVTLRGDWCDPGKSKKVRGTILAAYADKDFEYGLSFIRMQQCSGLTNLSIWYPEQNLSNPSAYPWTIEQVSGDSITVENVTLVNSYKGIKIGPQGNELHYITNLYGTALKTGIYVDMTTDIGRLQQINLSPDYWAGSGLKGAPKKHDLFEYMTAHAEGIVMGRSDWEYMADISISGFLNGIRVTRSATTGQTANAQMYKINIDQCNTALKIEGVNSFGLMVSDCSFKADVGDSPKAIYATSGFTTIAQFNAVEIDGGENDVVTEGTGVLSFENCTFKNRDSKNGYAIDAEDGSIILGQCCFESAKRHLLLGTNADLLNAYNSGYHGELKVENRSEAAQVNINANSDYPLDKIPEVQKTDIADQPRPGTNLLFDVTASPYNADRTGQADVSDIIQQALNNAKAAGGGTVYLPAGKYLVSKPLTVPSKVELRGSWDVPHHTVGGGTVIYTDHGDNAEDTAPPFISLEKSAGIRGLTIYYYQLNVNAIRPFSWTIQGKGPNVYVINVTLPNAYKAVDFGTYDTTGHYIDYVAGSPLKAGIYVGGGAKKGFIRNVQFNPHYWGRAPGDYPNIPSGNGFNILWNFQKDNLDAFRLGNVSNEIVFDTFVYGSLYGIHFAAENGKGPDAIVIGHGTDGSKVGAYVDGAAKNGVDLINTELVSMSSTDKVYMKIGEQFNSEARFFNTSMWGDPDRSVDVHAGKVVIQQANFTAVGQIGVNALGGETRLYDSYFQQGNRTHVYAGPNVAKVIVTNNIFRGGLKLVNNAIGRVLGTDITPISVELIKSAFDPAQPGKTTASLRLTNITNENPISGTIELIAPAAYQGILKPIRFEGIGLGQAVDIPLPYLSCDLIKFKVTLSSGYVYNTTVRLGQSFADRAGSSPAVPAPKITLNDIDHYYTLGGTWGGPDDLSLTADVKWDDRNLYVDVTVTDDVQYSIYSNGDIWQGDCLQLSVDLSRQDGAASKNVNELGFALNNDGTVNVWRWIAPAGLRSGPMNNVQAAITRDEASKQTYYHIVIPFSELTGPGSVYNPGDPIGFALLINENDAKGRSGFMEFNQGIGTTKDFTLFGDMYLLSSDYADLLNASAIAAVDQAVAQKTVTAVDAAANFVSLLPDGALKDQLNAKLAGVTPNPGGNPGSPGGPGSGDGSMPLIFKIIIQLFRLFWSRLPF